jgi:thiol:disulfide interchange protein DsbD
MTRSALPLALFAFCLASSPAFAQFGDPGERKLPKSFAKYADVRVEVVPEKAKAGETVVVKLTVTPKAGAHTYPAFPKDPTQRSKNEIVPPNPGDLIFIGKVADPPVKWQEEQRLGGSGNEKDEYSDKSVTWELKAVVSPQAKPGMKPIALDKVSLLVCRGDNCYPASGENLPLAELKVEEGKSDKINSADLDEAMNLVGQQPVRPKDNGNPGPPKVVPQPSAPIGAKSELRKVAKPKEVYAEEMKAFAANVVPPDEIETGGTGAKKEGWGPFILTAALWGLISLVTPCVFPMIPITVSIFLKQAHGSLGERLKLAAVYSLTIIAVLGVSAFSLLKFMAALSVHPVTNILLAALFLVLALSLFGMYELSLPNSLQRRLQSKQSQGGVVGTIFGALAFTVISFTCVAPFLGGFAGISAGNDNSGDLIALPTGKQIAGGLAFSTAFAAPFFILALVPGLMKALPKSGGWLDSVKVVMGFLELAAALKFLRTAELRILPTPQYFTYDVVLGGWVAISAACGLYLLNVYRLPHDEEKPNIGVPRLLFALCFLGLAFYLMPALFKTSEGKTQRPEGAIYAWVEAFLLPESEQWPSDLSEAIARSKATGKPLFVDFTGKTCTNCRYNEHNIFSRPEFRSKFDSFEKVQLYTDEVPATAYSSDPGHDARTTEARANGRFQLAVFGDIKLPLYAIMVPQPDGKLKLLGVYEEGKINDPEQFAAFMDKALKKAEPKQ